jgi:hypothetical protein
MLSHTIFELSPANDRRLFGEALVGAVSQWALNLLLEAYEERRSDAAAEFYDSIANNPNAGSLRGRMWERQVLKYLDLSRSHMFFPFALWTTPPSPNGSILVLPSVSCSKHQHSHSLFCLQFSLSIWSPKIQISPHLIHLSMDLIVSYS